MLISARSASARALLDMSPARWAAKCGVLINRTPFRNRVRIQRWFAGFVSRHKPGERESRDGPRDELVAHCERDTELASHQALAVRAADTPPGAASQSPRTPTSGSRHNGDLRSPFPSQAGPAWARNAPLKLTSTRRDGRAPDGPGPALCAGPAVGYWSRDGCSAHGWAGGACPGPTEQLRAHGFLAKASANAGAVAQAENERRD